MKAEKREALEKWINQRIIGELKHIVKNLIENEVDTEDLRYHPEEGEVDGGPYHDSSGARLLDHYKEDILVFCAKCGKQGTESQLRADGKAKNNSIDGHCGVGDMFPISMVTESVVEKLKAYKMMYDIIWLKIEECIQKAEKEKTDAVISSIPRRE